MLPDSPAHYLNQGQYGGAPSKHTIKGLLKLPALDQPTYAGSVPVGTALNRTEPSSKLQRAQEAAQAAAALSEIPDAVRKEALAITANSISRGLA